MSKRHNLKNLWFVMHHTDDPKRLVMAFTCYLDESGTDLHNSQAVVAGLIMSKYQFLMLDALWDDILKRHEIDPPLHMKEFGKCNRHGHLTYDKRFKLFTDVANFINANKFVSIGATLRHEHYKNIIHDKIKKYYGLYGLCFMICANACFKLARKKFYTGDLAFVMEPGNEHAELVRRAHRGMMEMKKDNKIFIHSGSLTFEGKKLSALQAADVIAWGINRHDKQGLGKGFQPIAKIFNNMHIQLPPNDKLLKECNDLFIEYLETIFEI